VYSDSRYHWALHRCPKHEKKGHWGTRYDTKEITLAPITWAYNEEELTTARGVNVLVRVLLGKVADEAKFDEIVRQVPIRWGQEGYERWTCKAWIREALERLAQGGVLCDGAVTEWERVHDRALEYVETKKAQHRFGGGPPGHCDGYRDDVVPTFDLMLDREIVP